MTGLSQKNGAVYSHLQIAAEPARLGANRLGLGDADLVLGMDMVAALGDEAFRTLDRRAAASSATTACCRPRCRR